MTGVPAVVQPRLMGATGKVWIRTYCDSWSEKAGDSDLPKFVRVAFHAFARVARNGHAYFYPGELADLVPALDKATGEVKPNTNIDREIKRAVQKGYLGDISNRRCLYVPPHVADGGVLGSPYATCRYH